MLQKVSQQVPGDLNSLEQKEAAPLLVVQLKQTVKRAARLELSWRGPTHDGLVRKFTSEKERKERYRGCLPVVASAATCARCQALAGSVCARQGAC